MVHPFPDCTTHWQASKRFSAISLSSPHSEPRRKDGEFYNPERTGSYSWKVASWVILLTAEWLRIVSKWFYNPLKFDGHHHLLFEGFANVFLPWLGANRRRFQTWRQAKLWLLQRCLQLQMISSNILDLIIKIWSVLQGGLGGFDTLHVHIS